MARKLQQGERTPPPVRAEIRRLAGMKDRPTNEEIQETVERRFGVIVSPRTIGRICAEAELPTGSKPGRPGSGVTQAWATNMELSGHWPSLRQKAGEIPAQLRLPLPQVLQFPWSYPHNPGLRWTPGKRGVEVGLAIEEDALFASLKKHLAGDRAWRLLRDWKRAAGDAVGDLLGLGRWGEAQPEVRDRQWLGEEALDRGETGMTRYFIPSLVLPAAEEACSLPKSARDWEVMEPNSQRETWVLRWVYNHSSFVRVAAALERTPLEEVQALHQELLVRMRSLEQVAAIGRQWVDLEGLAREFNREVDRIANLALYPGQCDLCAGR